MKKAQRSNIEKTPALDEYEKLAPVYIQKWVWQEICRKYPWKYKMFMPVYQNQRVILT